MEVCTIPGSPPGLSSRVVCSSKDQRNVEVLLHSTSKEKNGVVYYNVHVVLILGKVLLCISRVLAI